MTITQHSPRGLARCGIPPPPAPQSNQAGTEMNMSACDGTVTCDNLSQVLMSRRALFWKYKYIVVWVRDDNNVTILGIPIYIYCHYFIVTGQRAPNRTRFFQTAVLCCVCL